MSEGMVGQQRVARSDNNGWHGQLALVSVAVTGCNSSAFLSVAHALY